MVKNNYLNVFLCVHITVTIETLDSDLLVIFKPIDLLVLTGLKTTLQSKGRKE